MMSTITSFALVSIVACAVYGQSDFANKAANSGYYDNRQHGGGSYGQAGNAKRYGRYYYGGIFDKKCNNDGLYFFDETTFVICSNGNPHKQHCAPGTKNYGNGKYQQGYYYGTSDFCRVNLVDFGYAPESYAPDVKHKQNSDQGYQPKPYNTDTASFDNKGYVEGYGKAASNSYGYGAGSRGFHAEQEAPYAGYSAHARSN